MVYGIVAGILGVLGIGGWLGWRRLRCICRPGEVLVLTQRRGGNTQHADASALIAGGYRLVRSGNTFRIPFRERLFRFDVKPFSLAFTTSHVFEADEHESIELELRARAQMNDAEDALPQAIARYLGVSATSIQADIAGEIKDVMQQVLSAYDKEQLFASPQKVAQTALTQAQNHLAVSGVLLDQLSIHKLSTRATQSSLAPTSTPLAASAKPSESSDVSGKTIASSVRMESADSKEPNPPVVADRMNWLYAELPVNKRESVSAPKPVAKKGCDLLLRSCGPDRKAVQELLQKELGLMPGQADALLQRADQGEAAYLARKLTSDRAQALFDQFSALQAIVEIQS